MERFTVTRDQAVAAIRAMKAIAIADGKIGGHEDNLLRAAARALEVEDALDCTPMKPIEVAAKVKDPVARVRIVQAMEMMVIMDGRVDPAELEACEAFARALNVDEAQLRDLRESTRREMRRMQRDLQRRSALAGGAAADPALAARYQQLGALPAGSFGRAFWQHLADRNFPFPGEHLGTSEELVLHDATHVLSGYGTDVAGECENAVFTAALRKRDAFGALFLVAVHTHLDLPVFPAQSYLALEPERVIAALVRGSNVKRDLYDVSWDLWKELPRPLADVRADLGIT